MGNSEILGKDDKILSHDQSRMIEQAKFSYSKNKQKQLKIKGENK